MMKIPPPFRKPLVGPHDAEFRYAAGGVIYVRSPHPLGEYPRCLTDRLAHWADVVPERTYLAQREPSGNWRRLGYADAYRSVRAIGAALLARPVSPERPVVILSENSIEHALLGLAAMHVGIPYAPISPAYSLISQDFERLRHVIGVLTPGLVFAGDGGRYARAIRAVLGAEVETVLATGEIGGRRSTRFAELERAVPDARVEEAHARIDPDHPAKILFTSGSTAHPKGVINTHRILSCNQQMQNQAFPLYAQDPLVLVDWQPWHHTAGANANFGAVLYNGGSLYIDEGKPLPGAIETTVQNLREIAPTVYISVSRGFEMLIPYFRREPALRDRFFGGMRMLFYAGAGMSQHIWDELEDLSAEACGERVAIMTGLGSTETGPFAFAANFEIRDSRTVGLPASGVEVKLVPDGEKLEMRIRGPSITPGYWRDEALTRAAFDEEGYYRMGDALKFLDPADPAKGLAFDGRVAEDFKLTTATWVSVGALRVKTILACAPYLQDVVIAGHDRDYIAVLMVPNLHACESLCGNEGGEAARIVSHPAVRAKFLELLEHMAAESTGSSNRIERALLLETPPSLDLGEITDKGSLSQRAMLRHRAALVEELYAEPVSPRVIARTRG